MSMGPEVSIVMPCLNEAQTLPMCIEKAKQFLRDSRLEGEVIVADNGSTDGSQEIARTLGVLVIHVPVRGYGAALTAGMEAARGRYVVMGDADASYDFSAIGPMLEKLRQGHDLVMGSRLPEGGGTIVPGAMPWAHRWIGNPVLTGLGRLFFRTPVSDLYCGLRAFRRDAIAALDLQTTGMEFALEMVVKATMNGLRIGEVPVTLHEDGRSRPPHLHTLRDGWRSLRFMLLFSPTWLFLIPGGILFILGGGVGSILLVAPVRLFGIGFDTNTLLVCAAMMLIGFQLMAFAMFATVFAVSEGLLPERARVNAIFRVVTLEVGITTGLLLACLGFGLFVGGILYWQRHDFGPISYPESLRIIIPAMTLLVLGIEIIFSSFFLSMLGLRRK